MLYTHTNIALYINYSAIKEYIIKKNCHLVTMAQLLDSWRRRAAWKGSLSQHGLDAREEDKKNSCFYEVHILNNAVENKDMTDKTIFR